MSKIQNRPKIKFCLEKNTQIGQTVSTFPTSIYFPCTKYFKELLKKFKLEEAKKMKTLVHPPSTLGVDESSANVDNTIHRQMICSFLYLIMSRANIMFNVCLCTIFQYDLKETHMTIVKHIFHYLIGITNLGLCFKRREKYRL